jgi:hypothetical protein
MRAPLTVTILAVALLLGACIFGLDPEEERQGRLAAADRVVRDWMTEVVVGSDARRGYDLLHPAVRDAISLDRYVEAIGDFNAEDLEWQILSQTDRESSEVVDFFVVRVGVAGGSAALPADLEHLHLIQPLVEDGQEIGIAVVVRSDSAGVGIGTP